MNQMTKQRDEAEAEADDLAEVLTLKQLEPYTGGLGRSAIAELEKRGKFPSSIKLGERRRAWLKSEVIKWQKERIAAARKTR